MNWLKINTVPSFSLVKDPTYLIADVVISKKLDNESPNNYFYQLLTCRILNCVNDQIIDIVTFEIYIICEQDKLYIVFKKCIKEELYNEKKNLLDITFDCQLTRISSKSGKKYYSIYLKKNNNDNNNNEDYNQDNNNNEDHNKENKRDQLKNIVIIDK